ncbi:MAG: hypothetical protein Q9184_006932, partial [Pyrenodesmia sp. 2 TL-2023]
IPTGYSENANALLHHVRYSGEHSIPTRAGKYLDPTMLSWFPSSNESSRRVEGRVHFLCLPYFALSAYKSDKYVGAADAHPTRTLLQTQYPSASVERDLQQALISKGILFTSSRDSLDETQRGVAKVNTIEPIDASRDTAPTLHISDKSQDFVAHFSSLTNDFETAYCVIHRKVIQRPEDWQRLVLLAKKQTVLRLVLRSRRANITRRRTEISSSSDGSDLETNPLRHTRSSRPTMAGSKPTEYQDKAELSPPVTVEPTPTTSDRKNQMTTADLAGFDDAKSGTSKKSVKDSRADVQLVRVNDFHHFYWLAAAPTVPTSQDRSPLAGREEQEQEREREREQKDSISFNLDKRYLRQSVAQMQTYLRKRNKVSRQAYAQCPSYSLRTVDYWVAKNYGVKNEDDVIKSERKRDNWLRRQARKQARADKDRLIRQKTGQLQRIEAEHRLAKQREERLIENEMRSEDEQSSHRIEVLEKEEERRPAAEDLGRPVSEEQEAKGELSYSDDAERQESPDEHRSGSPSSSAGVSSSSPPDEFSDPIVSTDLPDQEDAKMILKLSKQLFEFFFPLAYSSSMTDKYWGAVFWLLHHRQASTAWRYEYHDDLGRIRSQLHSTARLLRLGPPPGELRLPIEFSRAWIHLLSFWTLITTNDSIGKLQGELSKCLLLIEVGRIKTLKSRISNPLEAHEAVFPAGIVSLLVSKTVGEVMDGSSDIGATYYAYLSKLEQEVQQKPYNRGHQEKITSVRQEISCILAVLQDQDECIRKLRTTLRRGRLDAPPGFPQRREAYILQNCLVSISDRMQTFNALDERARGIAAFNLYRIESNRDRQEGAILIFTIVTIIFLPLSFVSSFFGMNTSDIRGMSTPQWAFWASAIPLTLTVLGVSFFVARKIEPLKDLWYSLSDRWRTKPAAAGFYPAPAVQTQQLYARPQRVATGLQPRPTGLSFNDRGRRRQIAREDFGMYERPWVGFVSSLKASSRQLIRTFNFMRHITLAGTQGYYYSDLALLDQLVLDLCSPAALVMMGTPKLDSPWALRLLHSLLDRYSMTYLKDKPLHTSSKYQTFHPTPKWLKPAIIGIVKQTRLTPSGLLAPVTATSTQGPVTQIRHRDHRAQQPQQRKLEHGFPISVFTSIFTRKISAAASTVRTNSDTLTHKRSRFIQSSRSARQIRNASEQRSNNWP